MFSFKGLLLVAVAASLVSGARIARADTPVADPGFSYVDVNNDGLYSASAGDVAIPTSKVLSGYVDADTLVSGNHRSCHCGGCWSQDVSLVVPTSQNLTITVPLTLKAGVNVTVNGTLTAPSICIDAGRNADLTTSNLTVTHSLAVGADCDATLSGATLTATDPASEICIEACHDILGRPAGASNTPPNALAGKEIDFWAGDKALLTSTDLVTLSPPSSGYCGSFSGIRIEADRGVSATALSSLFTLGNIEIATDCGYTGCGYNNCGGAIDFSNSSAFAVGISLSAGQNITITGAAIDGSGAVNLCGGGQVTGGVGTAITASCLSVNGNCGVDLTHASAISNPGITTITSCYGPVTLNSASVIADAGLSVHARQDLSLTGAFVLADNSVKLTSDCGGVTADQSFINKFTPTLTNTYISVKSFDDISATGVQWTSSNHITVHSNCGNVDLTNATLTATNANGLLNLYAGGGALILTGATLTGTQQIGPTHVHVIH